jgi:hypothetical protein
VFSGKAINFLLKTFEIERSSHRSTFDTKAFMLKRKFPRKIFLLVGGYEIRKFQINLSSAVKDKPENCYILYRFFLMTFASFLQTPSSSKPNSQTSSFFVLVFFLFPHLTSYPLMDVQAMKDFFFEINKHSINKS